MKTHRLSKLSILIFIMSFTLAFAQDYFEVIISKGDVKYQKSGDKNWSDIKSVKKIVSGDNVRIGKNSYLGLKHNKGQLLEFRNETNINVKELLEGIKYDNSGILKKFGDYVYNQLKQSNNIMNKGDKKNYTSITGTVERSSEYKISSSMPHKFKTFQDEIEISWNDQNNDKFKLDINDRFGKTIISKEVSGNRIKLNQKELGLKEDNYYFWKVTSLKSKSDYSDDKCFNFLSEDKSQKIKSELDKLNASFNNKQNALSHLVLANFYDQNELFFEAQKEYLKAIELAPDVDEFKLMYNKFLSKNKYDR